MDNRNEMIMMMKHVKMITAIRGRQIKDIEGGLITPLRYAFQAGKRCEAHQISVEAYIAIQERMQKRMRAFFRRK